MKKKILISQRLDKIGQYKELRDNIDLRFVQLVEKIGCVPILIPNKIEKTTQYLKILKPDGVILTGGGNPYEKGLRKKTEINLINYAIKKRLSLLGICRGAQSINLYFKGKLNKIKNHVRKKHYIKGELFNDKIRFKVNSYHNYGIKTKNLGKNLKTLLRADDDSIEAFYSKNKKILGIMWHPERERKIQKINLKILKNFFKCT
ncbi:gamma-glutamyl-gamma-aminobutyrate hydrolase family protein [Candidatus Pelagibacter sp.]|nr:gamma-glutamyl-gamma-aminobutyrate hydrolase family protein [Candidatus Pelagibacter sp.]